MVVHNMARKQINTSKGLVFTALLIAGIILLLLPQNLTKRMNFLFLRVFNPVLSLGRATGPEFMTLTPSTEDFVSQAEYNRLLTEYDNVWAALREGHKRYEKLAGMQTKLPGPGGGLVLAQVRNVSTTSLRRELVINRGQNDKLKVGQYVLGKNAIVIGTISETSDAWSRIKMLVDTSSSIEVGIWNGKIKKYIRGQLVGDGKGAGRIPLISTEYEIRVKDTVYAAPRPGILETPVLIGNITSIRHDETKPLLWDIEVKPLCDLENIADVAVIVIEP